jgi:hypothetical protein
MMRGARMAEASVKFTAFRFTVLLFCCIGLLRVQCSCAAAPCFENEHFLFNIETYLRTDVVSFKNTVDLDSDNKEDAGAYIGLDYSVGFYAECKDWDTKLYLKLERNGPTDYDAPVFVHNKVMTTGGVIGAYRNEELLPGVEEFWFDAPLTGPVRLKAGLFAYEVGNGFSLNGAYENYGFALFGQSGHGLWRLYYCRPDLVYKNPLGPHIVQEEEQEIRHDHNAANFFAADVKLPVGRDCVNPYVGVLADYTSRGKRDNAFSAPIRRDILGTLGASWEGKRNDLSFGFEMAHNFGKADSADSAYKDVYHTGYLLFAEAGYRLGNCRPSLQLLLCSGNKVTPEMAEEKSSFLTSGKNRAFSSYSPLNRNQGDSISAANARVRPIVAMGAGYGLNYGIPRPGTLASTDFDNLIMPVLGVDIDLTKKVQIGFWGYYLSSFERGVGVLNGEGRYLSRDLGYELDVNVDYQLNRHTWVYILGGYFLPGRYYKERRDDASGSLLSPFVRGDGSVDCAYQLEMAVEFTF